MNFVRRLKLEGWRRKILQMELSVCLQLETLAANSSCQQFWDPKLQLSQLARPRSSQSMSKMRQPQKDTVGSPLTRLVSAFQRTIESLMEPPVHALAPKWSNWSKIQTWCYSTCTERKTELEKSRESTQQDKEKRGLQFSIVADLQRLKLSKSQNIHISKLQTI